MTYSEKQVKLSTLKYERNQLIVKQCGILEAMNNIPDDIYDPANPQIKSMREFCEKLADKERAISELIDNLQVEPVEFGE